MKYLKPTMFANGENSELTKTVRIMPHDQDTGGFYLALFRKTKEQVEKMSKAERKLSDEADPSEAPKEESKSEDPPQEVENQGEAPKEEEKKNWGRPPRGRPIYRNKHDFAPLGESFTDFQHIVDYWGLTLDCTSFFSSSEAKNKNLFYVSEDIVKLLAQDDRKKLKVLNLGVRAFTLNK